MAYFANGTEGHRLDAQCNRCPLSAEDANCPTLLVQLIYNYDQIGIDKLCDAMNLLVGEDGICETREGLVKIGLAEMSARDGS